MTIHYKKELFKIHSDGKIGDWKISVVENPDGTATITREACKVIGGKPVVTPTNITQGKNIGRSNETTPLQQALSEAESKYKKQLDKGYVVDMPKAGDAVTNSLGFRKPMLAHPIDKVKKWEFPVYAQPKFDGHRMLAAVQDDQVVLYSRQGKRVQVEHIRSALQNSFDEGHWCGTTLDGEVYIHGETLQKISSLVKKPQNGSENLEYRLYDIMYEEHSYEERLSAIRQVSENTSEELIVVTPTDLVYSHEQLDKFHSHMIGAGFEGTIVRHGNTPYEDGKRSRSLMKKKDFQDAEFKIVDISLGTPKIKNGTQLEVPSYKCVTDEGKEFDVVAPGNENQKHQAYLDWPNAKGKMLTVKFFNFTPDGIPFHPVALQIRDDI